MLLCGLNMDLQGRVKFLTGGMGAAAPEPATRCSHTRLLEPVSIERKNSD